MKGYERLSLLTSEFPELLILRRFDKLSSRILFRLQAELLYLEQELEVFIEQDEKENPEISTRWGKIREAGDQDFVVMHLDKYFEVEKKLKTYRMNTPFLAKPVCRGSSKMQMKPFCVCMIFTA